jgi:hypothetical protein
MIPCRDGKGQAVEEKVGDLRKKLHDFLMRVHEGPVENAVKQDLTDLCIRIGGCIQEALTSEPFRQESPGKDVSDGKSLRASGRNLNGDRIKLAKLGGRLATLAGFMSKSRNDTRHADTLDALKTDCVREQLRGEYPGSNFRTFSEKDAIKEIEAAIEAGIPQPELFLISVGSDGKRRFQKVSYNLALKTFINDGPQFNRAGFDDYVWRQLKEKKSALGIIA